MVPCKACREPLGKGGQHYHQRCIPKSKRIATGMAGGQKASLVARARKVGRLLQRAPQLLTRADLLVLLHEAEMSGYNRALQMVARRERLQQRNEPVA